MLDEALAYLEAHYAGDYELIVVSDGSRDRTAAVAQQYVARYGDERVRVLELQVRRHCHVPCVPPASRLTVCLSRPQSPSTSRLPLCAAHAVPSVGAFACRSVFVWFAFVCSYFNDDSTTLAKEAPCDAACCAREAARFW